MPSSTHNFAPTNRAQRRVQLSVSAAPEAAPPSAAHSAGLVMCHASAGLASAKPTHESATSRLAAPRLSLLGKPIYMSNHKSHYRNMPSMRRKMWLRAFLEQPQGSLAWLYHCSL